MRIEQHSIQIATNAQVFEHCEDILIEAISNLNSSQSREWLLSFVDPNISIVVRAHHPHRGSALVSRISALALEQLEVMNRLTELCEIELDDQKREILSEVLRSIGTSQTLCANLKMIADRAKHAIPTGTWRQLEETFVERRPAEKSFNTFTLHARESNEPRTQLFKMTYDDPKRCRSAFFLLSRIEEWRLEYGRPSGEPRHPDIASRKPWPPSEPTLQ